MHGNRASLIRVGRQIGSARFILTNAYPVLSHCFTIPYTKILNFFRAFHITSFVGNPTTLF